MKLRSPFNGEVWIVPPEHNTPVFVEAMIARGYVRVVADA